jgi:hypothetical protein
MIENDVMGRHSKSTYGFEFCRIVLRASSAWGELSTGIPIALSPRRDRTDLHSGRTRHDYSMIFALTNLPFAHPIHWRTVSAQRRSMHRRQEGSVNV